MNDAKLHTLLDETPTIKMGIGGNVYAFCMVREPLELICETIGKAPSSIVWHTKFDCFVFRTKHTKHKKALLEYRGNYDR